MCSHLSSLHTCPLPSNFLHLLFSSMMSCADQFISTSPVKPLRKERKRLYEDSGISTPDSKNSGPTVFRCITLSKISLQKSPIFIWCPFLVWNNGPLCLLCFLFIPTVPPCIPLFASLLPKTTRGTIKCGCFASWFRTSRYFRTPARSAFTISSPQSLQHSSLAPEQKPFQWS